MSTLLDTIRRLSSPLQPLPTGYKPRLQPLPGIRAVLFDVYGTLMISGSGDVGPDAADDDEQAFGEALGEALTGAGIAESPASGNGATLLRREIIRFQQRLRSEGADYPEVDILQVWQAVLSTSDLRGGPLAADAEAIRRLAVGYECRVNPVWPMPGADQTLATLRERGLPLGIVSNAQFYTPLLFEALLGRPLSQLGFDDALCVWSYRELRGKPSSRLFPKALASLQAKHGVTPAQTLYVGNDQLKDIWTASQAGCRTALFAGDRRSLRLREDDQRCRAVQADVVIDDLRQLPDLLE